METAVILAVFVGWMVAVYVSDPDRKIRAKLKKAARVQIGELQEGVAARIVGKAKVLDGKVLAGPLTERACVAYVGVVEQMKRHGDHRAWKTVARHQDGVTFLVEDDSGRAVVEVDGARLAIDFDQEDLMEAKYSTDKIEKFVEAHGTRGITLDRAHGKVRFREAVVELDELVAVLGAGVAEPDPDGVPDDAYRGTQRMRMRMASSKRDPVLISDSPETKA